ncbi:MAG TPA: 16S rRNA (adenine(1518)-N(6)/adenine(1519)-N(6))-dimethyltransferase RsmA [Phycisphaerales bacterium]|nr:16S rRNA (adenine(1518)-N(6)/adenine(1519)-N(6))-dimethyltransferase RsmA [Phycisphaerales bacterium]
MPQTLSEIRELLASHGLSPRHALGQNFLIDHNLLRRLVDVSGVGADDLVLEVGPGTGTLTEELLARGCEVVACELDRGLAGLLRERLGERARFTLVEGDCLDGKRALSGALASVLAGRPFSLVANLPYGSATPLMLTLLVDHPECRAMFVTIQREVAERLTVCEGSKAYGPLAVVAALLARVRTIAALGPECFWPRPEVTSAMVAVERRSDAPSLDGRALADFCQRVFAQRRKQIGSVLGRDFPWPEGVRPADRAESLPPGAVLELFRAEVVRSGAGRVA